MTTTSCPANDLAACWAGGVGSPAILGPAPAVTVGGRTPDSSVRYDEGDGRDSLVWCRSAEMICLAYGNGNGTDPLQPSQALLSLRAMIRTCGWRSAR